MMQASVWTLVIIGGLVVTIAAGFAVMLAITAFLDWRHEPHQRSFYEGGVDFRNRLANDAWWFSESPETCELLRELARGVNVSEARDRWRKARKEIDMPVDPTKK